MLRVYLNLNPVASVPWRQTPLSNIYLIYRHGRPQTTVHESARPIGVSGHFVHGHAQLNTRQRLIQGGKLRGLAVTTAKRTPAVPHMLTIAESAVPGFDVSSWYALFAPARTPPEIIRKMHDDTVAALSDPTTKERLEQLGVVVVGSTPEELAAFLKAEMDKWAPVIKEAGITIRE